MEKVFLKTHTTMNSKYRKILLLVGASLLLVALLLVQRQSSNPLEQATANATIDRPLDVAAEKLPLNSATIVPATESVVPVSQVAPVRIPQKLPDFAKIQAFDDWFA